MKFLKSTLLKNVAAGAVAGALVAAPAYFRHDAHPTAAVIQQVRSSSVNVFGLEGQGSGVIFHRFDKSYVLTAAHVLDGSAFHDTVQVSQGSRKWDALVVNIDEARDLALLRIDLPYLVGTSAVLRSSDDLLPIGTPLLHVGNTMGINGSYLEGQLSGVSRFDDEFDQSSILCWPGSSGGPIFLNDGTLVGILTRGIGPGLNFFIPVRHIHRYLRENDLQWLVR